MKIKEIIVFSNNIAKQKKFYKSTLGFQILKDTTNKISFKAGDSVLSFQYKENVKPSHFAFNIPYNSINQALKYLNGKAEVLFNKNNAITDFSAWKAKSIYFYDVDKNIIEFIARKRINKKGPINFTAQAILSISEIAIATNNIKTIHNKINSIKPITLFDGNFDRFCALGNDQGLFILIDKNKKYWYPTMEKAFTSDFIIKGEYNFSFLNGKIEEL